MEAKICVCLHDMRSATPASSKALQASGNSIHFTAPPSLQEMNFPVKDAQFPTELMLSRPTASQIDQNVLSSYASAFANNRQNLVVYAYGVRSTPKRQLMYGGNGNDGYALNLISDAIQRAKGIFTVSCYVLGATEHVVDLINVENELAVIVESVKQGPRVRMMERSRVASSNDVRAVLEKVQRNYERLFADVLLETQPTPEQEALPPYNGDTIILQLNRYMDEQSLTSYEDSNSMTFIALADCERPALCGVDANQFSAYERANRVLLSAVAIVASIKCNRLRVPFGKSKLSQLLRRAYNAEREDANRNENGHTNTVMLVHCFTDNKWAEESYHCLTMTRRACTALNMTGIGSKIRDMIVEKWRMDQDIVELRDELAIAKIVYEYKPSIFEAPKPVTNIQEEEARRIAAIQSRREKILQKQLAIINERAKTESDKLIKEQEKQSGTTLAELEKALETKRRENEQLYNDRTRRTQELEKSLEDVRRRKDEEESAIAALKTELAHLEEELSARQASIQNKQNQIYVIKLDKVKAQEVLLKERQSVQAVRDTVVSDRRRQREQWIRQIKHINEKVIEQINLLTEECRQEGETLSAKETAAEEAIKEDIKAIEEYLPRLISLEDHPVKPEETELIRRKFDEVFNEEKEIYAAKIESEKARKEKLERGLEAYRNRVLEVAQAKKYEHMEDAANKQRHLNFLIDQVILFVQQGTRMNKISSTGHIRRRFYYLSDDKRRIHSCELDSQGKPINRRHPPVTIYLKDIKKIVLGIYTPSFLSFSKESVLDSARLSVMTDKGTYRPDVTQTITPTNIGINNYRAFALMLRGDKTLEVICDRDSECEAWLVTLKKLLNIKTPAEALLERQSANMTSNSDETSGSTTKILTNTATSECEMNYGGRLDVRNMRGFISLSPKEAQLCSEYHIAPMLYLHARQENVEKAQTGIVTIYDIRISSGLDLIRSTYLYNFLVETRQIYINQ